MSTKINATVDALGNPPGCTLTPGQACELDGADILLPQIEADIVIADKGFDADERDKELYKARHLIEKFFANPRHRHSL